MRSISRTDCRAILDGVTALEREATTVDGGEYLLRLVPYRRANDPRITWGVVITLVDVTRLKEIERDLRAAREQAAGDLRRMTCLHKVTARLAQPGGVRAIQDDIVAAAVEIAGADMGTLQTCDEHGVLAITSQTGFGQAFLDYFGRVDAHSDTACSAAMAARERVVVEDVTKSPYFAGATLPVLLEAGVRALQSTPLFDLSGEFVGMLSTHYRSVRQFGQAELKWLDLLARQAADLITHRQSEEGLSRTNEQLERRIDERVKWLRLLHQVTRAIQEAATWDEAVRAALELTCAAEGWQVGFVYVPDPADADVLVPIVGCLRDERFRPFYEFSEEQRYTKSAQNLPGLVYTDGIVRWVNEAEELAALVPVRRAAVRKAGLVSAVAMPITFGPQVIGVLELFSDQPHTPDQTLVTLMVDISAQIGKIVERERMTAEMADLAWREQQGLLHTLHDTLGQTLTAVNVLSSALGRRLQEADAAAAATAGQIVQQARLALNQVRQLSRGMFPIDVESLDIMTALRELASATESIHRLRVQVDGDLSNSPLDSRVITHLYRIAQEAVTNAVKHAQADAIRIDVKSGQGFTRLRVTDNGVGIPGNGAHPGGSRVAGHAASGGVDPREPVDSSQSRGRNDRRVHAAAAARPSTPGLTPMNADPERVGLRPTLKGSACRRAVAPQVRSSSGGTEIRCRRHRRHWRTGP